MKGEYSIDSEVPYPAEIVRMEFPHCQSMRIIYHNYLI